MMDFEKNPHLVRAGIPILDVTVHAADEPHPSGRIGATRGVNSIIICHGNDGDTLWADALDELFSLLGGFDAVRRLLDDVAPKRKSIEFHIPVRGSWNQENGGFDVATLEMLVRLNLELGFDFPAFDPADPTHLSPTTAYGDEERAIIRSQSTALLSDS